MKNQFKLITSCYNGTWLYISSDVIAMLYEIVLYRDSNNRTLLYKISDHRQISNIRCALIGYEIVDHSDVVGASPVGAAPTTSSFST